MKNTFGNSLTVTLFGESHGVGIGAVIDGIAPGIKIDEEYIKLRLSQRRPSGNISTTRREPDEFIIESGVFGGYTTGTPICILIPNVNTKSGDYSDIRAKARPGHADYTAYCKYHGFEDYRGGGHFSGRITAALVAAGAIAELALKNKGIHIGCHIKSCAGVEDRAFCDIFEDIKLLQNRDFGVLDIEKAAEMQAKIENAKANLDSVGGILETAVMGMPAGVGEPWFDTVEGMLSHALFSIPAVKGVEFGLGFGFANQFGSEANDPFQVDDSGNIITTKNSNGGVLGGITNGMPVIFRCAVKPTPSIAIPQKTVNFIDKENVELEIKGRHDPSIVHRARIVVEAVTALTLCDLLTTRYGTDYLGAK